MSDGGAMTSVLACTAPDKFAAFAAVAVILFCGGKGKPPVALASFQGTADPIVPYDGGTVNCCGGSTTPSKPASMAKWAAFDHCAKQYTDTRLGTEVVRRTWKGCAKGSSVVFYIIEGGGHTWPGSIPIARFGMTTKQIDASAQIWKFFAAHKLAK
jgi:polyhydroxybutyrate depolymerase